MNLSKNVIAGDGDGQKSGARGFKTEEAVGERAVDGVKGLAEGLRRERDMIFGLIMAGLK